MPAQKTAVRGERCEDGWRVEPSEVELEFRILGPLEVLQEGRPVSLPGARERAVLCLLLLSANRVVSAERLVEDLWAGEPPEGALRALRVFVSRLRKSLRDAGGGDVVVTHAPGYVARVEPAAIDLARFEALVAVGRGQADGGAPDQAAVTLREALALWRGPAFAELTDAPLARAEAARLEEARLAASEDRIDADLACGRHREVVAELEALTRQHPLRERLWAQRMTALYRSGRQAEALRAYQGLRELLAEELGLDPSATLARLEGAVVRRDPELDWCPATPAPAAAVTERETAQGNALGDGPLTILFTDVEGSTDLRTRRGDHAAQQLLRAHEEVVRREVRSHGGQEIKALGDGFMLAFSSARRALACALAIQRSLGQGRFEADGLKVRIGLNTGEVVREGDDLYGQAVHAAARIAAKAGGGEVLVSEVVKALVGASPAFEFRDRGRYRLKGFPERFHLFEVPWQEEPGAAPAPFAERTPYVGREAERAELDRLLDRALQGQGTLVVIGGEPGVGKTRLTEEIGGEATRRGMLSLVGRCYEIEGAAPYVPFVEMLERALQGAPSPENFRQALGEDAPEVAKLLPRLRRLFGDIPPPLELPPEQERHYLFNGLRDCLARLASARPLFLVLDDLHWADEGTLRLLEHVAERLSELPILAVGTYRDTEVTPDHRLARPLDSLLRRRQARRVRLERFPADGVAGLLRAMSGQDPPAALVAAVHAESEGNPFFTEEVFKHLAEEGRLFAPDGRFLPEVTIREVDVPESLRLVLGRRLERLGDDGRRALAAAAVIGRDFTYELLEALGEFEPDALLDVLDEAERARLVAPVSDAPDEDRLLFSHELIRQTLLAGLSQARRRRLHLRVAETLERLHADAPGDQASQIAHHLTQAGPAIDRRRLLTYLTLAGRHAQATAGFEDALRHFEGALALREVVEPAQWPTLFADVAMALRSLGRHDEALASWEQARELYDEIGDAAGVAQTCFQASQDLWWVNRDQEAVRLAERAVRALGDRPTPQRARLLGWAGVAGAWTLPYDAGATAIDEALELAEQLGDKHLLGRVLVQKALHRVAFAHHQETLDIGREGIAFLRDTGDMWEVATALSQMEMAATELGQWDLAAEIGDEVSRLGRQLGHFFILDVIQAPTQACRRFAADPDLNRLEGAGRRHLDVAGVMGYRHQSYVILGNAAFLRGNWDDALRLTEEATRHSPIGNATMGMDWGALLQTLAYSGDRPRALAVLDERRDDLPRAGRPNGWGYWQLAMAAVEALYVLGERQRAARLYPLMEEFIATTGTVITILQSWLTERIAGIAAAAGSHWDLAERHFERALQQAEGLPHVLEGAETRRFYAEMLLERNAPGDRELAGALLQDAVAVYRRIGMPRHEDMAGTLVAL